MTCDSSVASGGPGSPILSALTWVVLCRQLPEARPAAALRRRLAAGPGRAARGPVLRQHGGGAADRVRGGGQGERGNPAAGRAAYRRSGGAAGVDVPAGLRGGGL